MRKYFQIETGLRLKYRGFATIIWTIAIILQLMMQIIQSFFKIFHVCSLAHVPYERVILVHLLRLGMIFSKSEESIIYAGEFETEDSSKEAEDQITA